MVFSVQNTNVSLFDVRTSRVLFTVNIFSVLSKNNFVSFDMMKLQSMYMYCTTYTYVLVGKLKFCNEKGILNDILGRKLVFTERNF